MPRVTRGTKKRKRRTKILKLDKRSFGGREAIIIGRPRRLLKKPFSIPTGIEELKKENSDAFGSFASRLPLKTMGFPTAVLSMV